MTDVRFEALEHRADGGFDPVTLRYVGSSERGWDIERNGDPAMTLGPGYRLLRTIACGICSTDLARRFLPFPLPQVIGHELVAVDENGARFAVEINASHRARGVDDCPFCSAGLPTHCPERLVLGIHDLPGGFGPWVLAPVDATVAIPDVIPTETAALLEPFAAAMHAVTSVAPRPGERVAVLGPRRLGMLVVAALRAHARAHGIDHEIVALTRRPDLLPLARAMGATEALVVDADDPSEAASAGVVIDTTGNPAGLELALGLATREVHLKSTHGQEAAGLRHTTELVVDELAVAPLDGTPTGRVAWLASTPPLAPNADVTVSSDPAALLEIGTSIEPLGRFDAAVVDSASGVDAVIRPSPDHETALIRPRGRIFVHPDHDDPSPLLRAVAERGIRLSSSRCGDFRSALERMAADSDLLALGSRLVTHHFDATELPEAFHIASQSECVKAMVHQHQLR